MSSFSSTYPSVSPTYQIDFSNGKRIPPNATFSRPDSPINPSNATADYLHYWSNEKHLSSENLLLQSEDFTTTWSTSEAGGSAGATAPDGGADAYTITCYTASSKAPRVSQSLSGKLSANTQYTMVGHVKAGTATHGFISFRGTNSNNYAYAQIEFASPSSPSTGGVGFTSISGTVTALGSSWYRLTLTATTGSDVSGAFAFLGVNDGTAFGISGYPIWNTAAETLEIWGAQISTTQAKVYDSPTTTSIHRAYAPTLKSPATAGDPRFEYDPVTNASLGCLIESQSTNLLLASESFNDSYWTKYRATISMNAAIAPSGELTADLFVAEQTGSAQTHIVESASQAFTSGTAYTFSIFVKPAGFSKIRIAAANTSTWAAAADYDLTGSGSVSGVTGTASAIAVGNGWFRCILTGTAGATASTPTYVFLDNGSGTSFDGDDHSGVTIWGAQFEEGTLSSYITTLLSARTRAADRLEADLTSVGNEVTVVGEAISTAVTSDRETVFHITPLNASTVSAYAGRAVGGGTSSVFYGGSSGVYLAGSTVTAGSAYKFALRTAPANHGMSYNGGTVATETTTVPPYDFDTLHIGSRSDGSNAINGHVKRIAVYNEALSDTNLQALTS